MGNFSAFPIMSSMAYNKIVTRWETTPSGRCSFTLEQYDFYVAIFRPSSGAGAAPLAVGWRAYLAPMMASASAGGRRLRCAREWTPQTICLSYKSTVRKMVKFSLSVLLCFAATVFHIFLWGVFAWPTRKQK